MEIMLITSFIYSIGNESNRNKHKVTGRDYTNGVIQTAIQAGEIDSCGPSDKPAAGFILVFPASPTMCLFQPEKI